MAPVTANTKATAHAFRKMHEVEIQESDLTTLTTTISQVISPKVTQESCSDTPGNLDKPPF